MEYSVIFYVDNPDQNIQAIEGPLASKEEATHYAFWSLETQCTEKVRARIVPFDQQPTNDSPELPQATITDLMERIEFPL